MRNISIGIEPISVSGAYIATQTATEGDFAQSLKEVVDMGSPSIGLEQPVQVSPEQFVQSDIEQPVQSIPEQSVQIIPKQSVPGDSEQPVQVIPGWFTQVIPEQYEQVIPEYSEQVIPEQYEQVIPEYSEQVIPDQSEQLIPEQSKQVIPGRFVQVIPEQLEQHILEQSVQVIPEQTAEDIPEQSVQVIPEQPEVQDAAHKETPKAGQRKEQPKPQELADIPVTVYAPKSEQADSVSEKPTQPAAAIVTDPELVKELEDLLGSKEKMLTAPQRLQKTLGNMIVQALSELSDPEKQEEEFTEMVLDFLMEFVDRQFGGENPETSIFSETENKDDNVQDVLLQAVVQMLEDIRSENAETELPEDEQAVEGIPSNGMVKEYVSTTASDLLSEETRQVIKLDDFIEPADLQTTAVTQPKPHIEAPVEEVSREERKAGMTREPQPTESTKPIEPTEIAQTRNPKLYQAAMQAAEIIYAAVTQTYKPVTQETQTAQPVREGRSGMAIKVSLIQPADELEELTRLVKGGESITAEQPQLDLSSEKQPQTEQIKSASDPAAPKVQLETADEAVPFEAVITSTVPQITLTRAFEGAQSGAQQIVTQIASEIFNQLPENGGTTTFVMTLSPETLGKVTVKVVEEAGKISVSITAHSKRTAEILSERFDNLQTAMKENGTQLEKYQVVYAPEKDERPGQQSFDGSSKNPYVKQDDEESEGDGEFAELLQQVV